ncbi:hypothetical protein J6U78_03885 [bacterium]|nr:hypothetical protein [bacterium]
MEEKVFYLEDGIYKRALHAEDAFCKKQQGKELFTQSEVTKMLQADLKKMEKAEQEKKVEEKKAQAKKSNKD